jgi:tetratricopeptide (TPR) repeat protein
MYWVLVSSWYGPTPARQAIARCEEILEQTSSRQVEGVGRVELGALLALSGRFDEARRSWEDGVAILGELGLPIAAAGSSQERFDIERLAGDLPAAEAVLREACDLLQRLGEKGFLSTRAACLGLCLALQERPADAEPFLELALETMPSDSLDVVKLVHMARAVTHLAQGSLVEAEEHARKAVAAIADWDMPKDRGDTLVLLGDVLGAAGRADEAIAAYSEALALFEQKENRVGAAGVSRSLGFLQAETTA